MSAMTYKTFTVNISDESMLDEIVPVAMSELQSMYVSIAELKEKYAEWLQLCKVSTDRYSELETVSIKLSDTAASLGDVFRDIDARLEYFTCVMIGAVSAGKTSLICDLAQLSPEDLNRRIEASGQRQFESGLDDIEIGPSVATTNLYELLFQQARMRLVDVPGIGGVVHSNDTLAPFVRLADCVIFMISADRDIMKDDLDFIRNHILNVALQKEGGVDKSRLPEVVVVVNKWLSNKIDECSSRDQLDVEFEERRNWILEGDPRKGFDGIAKYFGGKTPHIVWTETTRRNSQGDILQKWQPGAVDSRFTVDGILTSVSTILAEDGPEVRLSRPLRVLRSDMMSLKTFLFEVNVQGMLQGKFDQLETVSQGIQAKEDSARERLQQRLDRFERRVSDYVSSSLRATLSGWNPSIGVIDGTIGAINKGKMQDRLSSRWGDELRSIIEKDFDFDRFNQMIDDEAKEISRTVAVELQRYIQGEDGKIIKDALSDTFSEGDQMSGSFGGANDSVTVDSDSIAKNIEMGIMKSIGSLLTANIILAVVASSFLTPLGGALVVALQRMWQGGKQKAQAREKLFDSIDLLSADSAQKIRKDVQAEIERKVESFARNLTNVISKSKEEISVPLKVIKTLQAELDELIAELDDVEAGVKVR